MDVLFWMGGAVSAVLLATNLSDGGWKRVVPLLLWFAVMLSISNALPTTAERVVALVVTFAGALWRRGWTARRAA
jgi:hypothetical protein